MHRPSLSILTLAVALGAAHSGGHPQQSRFDYHGPTGRKRSRKQRGKFLSAAARRKTNRRK